MKLRNKKTGAIYKIENIDLSNNQDVSNTQDGIWLGMTKYNSLAELNAEWEDVPEELKTHWMIDTSVLEPVREIAGNPYEIDKEIGNWFSTKEEAEKAVEKLKALKRLKDKGVKLEIVTIGHRKYLEPTAEDDKTFDEAKELIKDFEFIFGGEK